MAPLQRSKSATQLQIQHFTHQHLLHKLYMTFEYNCDGCNTGGYGVRYRCSACDFDLHEQCATSPHRISSHLHPHQQLVLVNRPGESRLCLVCKGFTNGLCYTCECQNQICEFNVHPLCIQVEQPGGVSWGHPTPGIESTNNQPVMINQQQQQMQGIPTTGVRNSQPVMVNQTQMQGSVFSANNLLNNSQPVMIHHHHQQQGIPTVAFGQPVILNHQKKEGMPTTDQLGCYHGANNNHPIQMMNYQQPPLSQGIPTASFGGYQGGNSSQVMSVNQLQQQQGIPTTRFNGHLQMNTTNQQMMINPNQQQQQQQPQGIPTAAMGQGYTVVNNNQTVMINQQQHPQQQQQMQLQPVKSNNYSKVGKLAANILTTSLIGVPIFRN